MVTLDDAGPAREARGLLQVLGAAQAQKPTQVPWTAVADWVRAARGLTRPLRATVAGAHPMLASSVPRRTPCCSASITAPPAPSWLRSIGATTRWSVFTPPMATPGTGIPP